MLLAFLLKILEFLSPGHDREKLEKLEVWSDVVDTVNKWMGGGERNNIVDMIGIKVTNAISLGSGQLGSGIYPLYPLMNSHCYCNTRWDIFFSCLGSLD